MDQITRLIKIIETYERAGAKLERGGISFGPTQGDGFWTATRWDHIIPFLEWAVKKEVIHPSGPVVDAGSGTGEPSAFFNAYGFGPIVNIELSGELVDAANEAIDDLVNNGVIRGGIRTAQGDFTQDDPYQAAGIRFKDVGCFYHAINSRPLKRLVERIEGESPRGTKLIVYGMFDENFMPPASTLTLKEKFRTPDMMGDFYVYRK